MSSSGQPIFFLIHGLSGGGAERVVVDLANNWPTLPSGNLPIVVVCHQADDYRNLLRSDIKVLSLDVIVSRNSTFIFAWRLRQLVKTHKPKCVISHLQPVNFLALRAKLFQFISCPIIVVEHNKSFPDLAQQNVKSKIRKRLEAVELSFFYSLADQIICVSDGISNDLRLKYGLSADKLLTINNPIDVDAVQAASGRKPDIAFADNFLALPRPILMGVGRLAAQKNFSAMIRAFALVPPEKRGTLVILGEGEEREMLESLIAELDLQERVLLPGFILNPWWFVRHADLFVLSSRWEGYPMVILEALACSTPILSTDCDFGPREMIDLGVTGELVAVDDIVDLSRQMTLMPRDWPSNLADARMPRLHSLAPATVAERYASAI